MDKLLQSAQVNAGEGLVASGSLEPASGEPASLSLVGALRNFQSYYSNSRFFDLCHTLHLGGFGSMENIATGCAGRHVVDLGDLNIDIFLEVQDNRYSY